MSHYDEIVKHLMDRFPDAFAALALKTSDVEVQEKLTTEQPTIKVHHSDMTFKVRLPNEEAILHIEAQTDESRDNPEVFQAFISEEIMQESPFYEVVMQRGFERGVEQGIEQGIEQGARETSIANILAVLTARFPQRDPHPVQHALEAILDLDRLTQLLQTAALTPTFEAFLQALDA
jgi:predicted transposase YdaD